MMLMKTFARLKFDKNVLQMLPLNALQVPKTSTETSGVQVVTEKHHEFRNSHINRREPIICLKANSILFRLCTVCLRSTEHGMKKDQPCVTFICVVYSSVV